MAYERLKTLGALAAVPLAGSICLAAGYWQRDILFPERERKPKATTPPTETATATQETETLPPQTLPEDFDSLVAPPSTPSPVEVVPGGERNCIPIEPNHPNAYKAWLQLDKPDKVIFENLSGPDRTDEKVKLNAPGELPRTVHFGGDRICALKGFNQKSKAILGSHPGFGVRP